MLLNVKMSKKNFMQTFQNVVHLLKSKTQYDNLLAMGGRRI